MSSNIHTRNHVKYNPPGNPFNPVVKSTPQLQWLGIFSIIIKSKKEKLTIVTDNRDHIFPISFIGQIGVTQKNELLIQIA